MEVSDANIKDKRQHLATYDYSCRTSGDLAVKHQASQAIMVRPCLFVYMIRCRKQYDMEQWIRMVGRRGKLLKSCRPVTDVTATHCRRHNKLMRTVCAAIIMDLGGISNDTRASRD